MGHTYTNLINHIVYSTKYRRPIITPDVLTRLVEFTGGLIRQREGSLLAMNGTDNHVHVLAILTPKIAVSEQLRDIKSLSSGWIHDTFPSCSDFGWQEGYADFSVGKSDLDRVVRYIADQQKHHRQVTFEEELISMLKRAGVEYDPKYVFD